MPFPPANPVQRASLPYHPARGQTSSHPMWAWPHAAALKARGSASSGDRRTIPVLPTSLRVPGDTKRGSRRLESPSGDTNQNPPPPSRIHLVSRQRSRDSFRNPRHSRQPPRFTRRRFATPLPRSRDSRRRSRDSSRIFPDSSRVSPGSSRKPVPASRLKPPPSRIHPSPLRNQRVSRQPPGHTIQPGEGMETKRRPGERAARGSRRPDRRRLHPC